MTQFERRKIPYKHVKGDVHGLFRVTKSGVDSVPSFIVAPSAALNRKNLSQLGLYAGKEFSAKTNIGPYTGALLGTYDSARAASTSNEAEENKENTMLLVRETKEQQYELIDGQKAEAPYLSLCNDPKGTGMETNVRPSKFGVLYTTTRIPAFDLNKPLEENIKSELLWDYGPKYWKNRAPRPKKEISKSMRNGRKKASNR